MVVFNQRQEISGRDSGQVRRGIAEIGGTFLFAAKGGLWRPGGHQLYPKEPWHDGQATGSIPDL